MVRGVLWILLLASLGCHGRVARAEAVTGWAPNQGCKGDTNLRWPSAELVLLGQAELEPEPASGSHSPAKQPKLDRHTKIELMFILIMLVAVGLGLIAFTWLTARLTRRYMKPAEKFPARRPDPVFTDDWAAKPLSDQERGKLDSSEW